MIVGGDDDETLLGGVSDCDGVDVTDGDDDDETLVDGVSDCDGVGVIVGEDEKPTDTGTLEFALPPFPSPP